MKTGFKVLDEKLKLENGELLLIGSRPSMGKTTFIEKILSNVATREKKCVLYFSLESNKESIVKRLITQNSQLKSSKSNQLKKEDNFKSGLTKEEWNNIADNINLLKEAQIYIWDEPNLSIDEIGKKSQEAKESKKIELIILDYLQLIRFDKSRLLSRELEIIEILKRLKLLAKELHIPIIITSQLARNIESRQDKRPILSDLNNLVLEYVDSVLFLYREVYDNKEIKNNSTEVIIAKNKKEELATVTIELY